MNIFHLNLIVMVLALAINPTCANACPQQQEGQKAENQKDDSTQDEQDEKKEALIRGLIEQLVYADGEANDQPVVNPNMKIADADGNVKPISGESDEAEEERKRFDRCQKAFGRLLKLKAPSIPYLVEHLDDKRQSINFRNHYLGNSVGDACYWNIYYQLVDQPRDYSEYGYAREGKDGESHPKPYWEGTPFDEAGGIKEWLDANKSLNYVEMQIKCLQWLLEGEKKIGACDADSYFLNIHPLEIRILERRIDNGEDLVDELKRMKRIRSKRLINEIPKELLPKR